jgi:hypothetical protein
VSPPDNRTSGFACENNSSTAVDALTHTIAKRGNRGRAPPHVTCAVGERQLFDGTRNWRKCARRPATVKHLLPCSVGAPHLLRQKKCTCSLESGQRACCSTERIERIASTADVDQLGGKTLPCDRRQLVEIAKHDDNKSSKQGIVFHNNLQSVVNVSQ